MERIPWKGAEEMDTNQSTKKGQARIQELMEMFPEIPRVVVVGYDADREGLRHTAILNDVGRWALPDAHDAFDFDYDEHAEEDLVEGISSTPVAMFIGNDGTRIDIHRKSDSPYEVRYEGHGRYWLYRDGEAIEQVYFLFAPRWFWKKTSTGTPMDLVIHKEYDKYCQVCITSFCEYVKDDLECRFCVLSSTFTKMNKLRTHRQVVEKREQDIYEAYLAFAQEESEVKQVLITGGTYYNRSKEVDTRIRHVKNMMRAIKDSGTGPEGIWVVSQAMEEKDQIRLKEAGTCAVCWNLEVWDPELFPVICPGKSKNVGRDRWIELMVKAVDVFGWGNVFTNFVAGVSMIPPYGNKTEDEEFESLVEGMRYLASHGISVRTTCVRPLPGSKIAGGRPPRVEYYLRVQREIFNLTNEYNLKWTNTHKKGPW